MSLQDEIASIKNELAEIRAISKPIVEVIDIRKEVNDIKQRTDLIVEVVNIRKEVEDIRKETDAIRKSSGGESKKEIVVEKKIVCDNKENKKKVEEERKAKEAEEARKVKEVEEARKVKEAEEARKAKEAEEARKVKEAEEARKVKEAEKARKAKEAEEARKAKEAEEARKVKEAEKARKAKEAEKAKQKSNNKPAGKINPKPQAGEKINNLLTADCREYYDNIRSNNDGLTWVFLEYTNNNTVSVGASGTGDISGLASCFNDSICGYGYLKVETPDNREKFVLVSFTGESSPIMRRARMSVHKSSIKDVFRDFSVEIQASDVEDLDPSKVMNSVIKAAGANYSFNN